MENEEDRKFIEACLELKYGTQMVQACSRYVQFHYTHGRKKAVRIWEIIRDMRKSLPPVLAQHLKCFVIFDSDHLPRAVIDHEEALLLQHAKEFNDKLQQKVIL